MKPRALPIDEEKCPILLYRTAKHKTVLIAAESRLGSGGCKHVAGIQCLVTEKLEQSTVPLVCSRLLVDHDHAAIGAAKFGGVAVRFNPEFFNRVDYREIRDLTRLGLQHADAVIDVFADPRPASVDARQCRVRRQHDARRERDQRNEVAAIQRQGYDLLLVRHEAYRSAARLQQRSRGRDFHELIDVSYGQRQIQIQMIAHPQTDAGPFQRGKTLFSDRDLVVAGRKREKTIRAVGAGADLQFRIGAGVGDSDLGFRHGQPGGIPDDPCQLRFRGLQGAGDQQEKQDRHGDDLIHF